MNYIPQKVRELFINLFERFSALDESQYKEEILKIASDEEVEDLKDLFQSTSDYYEEQRRINESGKTPSEYLFDLYIEEWKNQNPNATGEEEKAAIEDFNTLLSDEILKSADKLIEDGVLRKKLEILERKRKERSDEEEKVIDDFLLENNLYGLNQDEDTIEPAQTSDKD